MDDCGFIMGIRDFLKGRWFGRGVITLWLISSVFVLVLLIKIDGLVHGTLYGYGLQFDYEWAEPYWFLLRLAFVGLALPMVFGGIILFSSFLRTDNAETQISERSETIALSSAQTSARTDAQTSAQTDAQTSAQTNSKTSARTRTSAQMSAKTSGRTNAQRSAQTSDRALLISCSSCKKVISKPLVLLDFTGGKEKLVNVCPYCNGVLSSAEEKDNSSGVVVDLQREVVDAEEINHRKRKTSNPKRAC